MSDRIAIVTGGNRGLGLEIARQLTVQGIRVILTARNIQKGQQAVKDLALEGISVQFYALDVTRSSSIEGLTIFMNQEFGRCDILINSAGIFPDIMTGNAVDHDKGDVNGALNVSIKNIREAMETNVYGPLQLSQQLVPLMKRNNYGRIVNISSGLGQLTDYEGDGKFIAYRLSKTALNMLTCTFAAELKGTNILVNSVCPGWCQTDMGGPNALRSSQEGAKGVVWLATLADNGPSGGFFRDQKLISW
jgi:NAD(P)-dependent dehydrogenase (short-subunit alcohol dehydrogenase family)